MAKKPAPKKPAPKKPAPKKPAPKKPKKPTTATPRQYATTDEAFTASLEQIRKTDPGLFNAIVNSMGFGRKVEEEMLTTQMSEELPQKLQDLENEATRQWHG